MPTRAPQDRPRQLRFGDLDGNQAGSSTLVAEPEEKITREALAIASTGAHAWLLQLFYDPINLGRADDVVPFCQTKHGPDRKQSFGLLGNFGCEGDHRVSGSTGCQLLTECHFAETDDDVASLAPIDDTKGAIACRD
jgi:hypothetical protein